MSQCYLILVPYLLLFSQVTCEVYTALTDLQELLKTEGLLIHTLENYISAEELRISHLKKYADNCKKQYNQATSYTESYVGNPLNAYTLTKRLRVDWQEVESLIQTDIREDYLKNITYAKENMTFPTDEDLNGAAQAVFRLQDLYRIDTASLARGELRGVKYSSELTAADCFELGRQSYNNDDFYHTVLWMQEADNRLEREDNKTVGKSAILDYLAFSSYKLGNIKFALELTNKLLELVPTHERALYNKIFYEEEIQKESYKELDDEGDRETEKNDGRSSAIKRYEALCRGELTLSEEKVAKLNCRYVTNNNPYLLIAPFKVEQAHADPDLFIFHDVMSDDEIKTIKKLATPKFQRAKVRNLVTGEAEKAQYRISKSSWLNDSEHEHVAAVSRRVEDMTGLTVSTAEKLGVANYGIGGYYDVHVDFSRKYEKHKFENLGTGNRIATVLFYMSDVEQGGATVFPEIGVAVWPKKGTAVFWYNLFPSGDGNRLTLHGACPVLAGSKWISNKWFHEKGQEFLRPCTLERPPHDLTL